MNTLIEWAPYTIRTINTISYIETNGYAYPHKFTDRIWLNDALKHAGTDEIIITENGMIKDASYANLALYNGQQWHTPVSPLLPGTKRASLIDQGILVAKEIHVKDLNQYAQVKFINAMMTWEESPVVLLKPI
jgi:4-amino-4-deoxychorismate lyase